jgi:hypothetical protein
MLMLLVAMMWCAGFSYAQHDQRKMNYRKEPHWIYMMNNPSVNYFEAVRAFELFWKDKPVPLEEEEWEIAGIEKQKAFSLLRFRSKERKEEEGNQYLVEYRQFKMWQRSVQAYLKPDGTLLSMEERLSLWKKLRE